MNFIEKRERKEITFNLDKIKSSIITIHNYRHLNLNNNTV